MSIDLCAKLTRKINDLEGKEVMDVKKVCKFKKK